MWSTLGDRNKQCKVEVLDSITYLYHTPIFEWYVVRYGSKNGYQKDMCSKYNGLHSQNVETNLGSIVNIIGKGDLHDHLINMRVFTLIMSNIFI